MNETRKRVLRVLKTRGQATVTELAEAVGISPIAVRHHLGALQAEGLIRAEEIRHGVGRPHHVFQLTEAGHEQFPQRYVRLTERLLDELKAALPPEAIEHLFVSMASGLATEIRAKLAGLPPDEKMAALVDALGEEGFIAHWERAGGSLVLTGVNCPYLHIGQHHPEVCQFDIQLVSTVMEAPVERSTCIIRGDAQCTFTIAPD